MTAAEMHTAVKILLDKEDTLNYPNYRPEGIDFFLNLAQDRFVKHRYDGSSARNRGFEETQKRTDDLRNITTGVQLTPLAFSTVDNYPNGRFVDLPLTSPNKYLFSITEQAEIYFPACSPNNKPVVSGDIRFLDPKTGTVQYYIVTKGEVEYSGVTYSASSGPVIFNGQQGIFGGNTEREDITTFTGDGTVYKADRDRVDVKPIQHDDYNRLAKDPFNRPSLDIGTKELLRLELEGRFEILFPSYDYVFDSLILRYIREPQRISLSSLTDCELADHTHQEIVDMAVSSMLENIESQRYQSNLNELNKLE